VSARTSTDRLLRTHADVLAELVGEPKTRAATAEALADRDCGPPSKSRVYQVFDELSDDGLIHKVGDGEAHNAVVYAPTEDGEVRVKSYVAWLGSRVFD
jgi:DNA-binding PadR family transcriptional regulator